eukprot:1771885-Heterocapsa_arctica.AAC.1
MARDFGSTLGPQHPHTPRLSNRSELRQQRFSAADWQRLSGGPGHQIGVTWCDALKLANICPDLDIFDEVLSLRDAGRGYLPAALEARC